MNRMAIAVFMVDLLVPDLFVFVLFATRQPGFVVKSYSKAGEQNDGSLEDGE